jgi:ribonuclease HII
MDYIIGIDEVGRGALAGPVVVVAASTKGNWRAGSQKLGILKDSKKLTAKQREAWYAYFKNHPNIAFALARVYPRQIERRNISQAANLAAKRALQKLLMNTSLTRPGAKNIIKVPAIFLDGGLYLGNRKNQTAKFPNAKTIVKADEKIPAVSITSIIAKVHRDQFMKKLSKKYPQYGFEIHKGYGTKIHRKAIRKHGPSKAHRLTFLGKLNTL